MNIKTLYRMSAWVAALCVSLAPLAQAKQVDVNVAMSTPVIEANKTTTAYVQISMTGIPLPKETKRAPVNLAIVLDKSGSMQGQKLVHAKEAACNAVNMLSDNDIVSIVTYDTYVQVLVPATKASDRNNIINRINSIQAGSSTALFAGVSKGAYEVRKFLGGDRVNRIILLSDGLANQGPSSPGELGQLGRSLARDGMSVSTIGLGLDYNEDLMTQLAMNSDGNHMFAESPQDVKVAFSKELGDVLSVVAQDVSISFSCKKGIRPVKVLGREAEISGQNVRLSMNQLYNEQTKYVILEVEVPSIDVGAETIVGDAKVSYSNMHTKASETQKFTVSVIGTASPEAVEKHVDKNIMASVIHMQAVANNERALELKDIGRVKEGQDLLRKNVLFLNTNAERYDNDELRDYGLSNQVQVELFVEDDASFKRSRKGIKEEQYKLKNQQGNKSRSSSSGRDSR